MRGGSKDWIFDQDITMASHNSLSVDIHHIFPKKWCNENQIDDLRRESIVNKTAISAETNRKIGGRAPSAYIPVVLKESESDYDRLQVILEKHHVNLDALERDDFNAFFAARQSALLMLISDATGKAVAMGSPTTPAAEYDVEEEEPADEDVASLAS
jgi:hypothetical protein